MRKMIKFIKQYRPIIIAFALLMVFIIGLLFIQRNENKDTPMIAENDSLKTDVDSTYAFGDDYQKTKENKGLSDLGGGRSPFRISKT